MSLVKTVRKFVDVIKQNKLINPNLFKYIETNNNEISFSFNVKLNDRIERFSGFRVQNNNCLGPYKGGLRFAEFVDLDECSALAQWMTLKCSLLGLPYGGGKGGAKLNPRLYNEHELELISRSLCRSLVPYIGVDKDIPAPDLGTNSKIMDYMIDEYQQITGTNTLGVLTGKSLGGSLGRTEATGNGVFITIERLLTHLKVRLSDTTFIVQGFGNVGSYAAHYMYNSGAKCIGVGDHTGYFVDNNGINIVELFEYNKSNGSINGFKNYMNIDKHSFFSTKCDILIAAAMEHEITNDIANIMDCKIVAEGANGPTTFEADQILNSKNIIVIPDILCNSGGVTVSYFEWLQNKSGEYWELERVNSQLKNRLVSTFDTVYLNRPLGNMSLRESCYYYSLKNLEIHHKKRGDL